MKVLLFKDSNCDICKLMYHEFIDNPPSADVEIIHVSRENCSEKAVIYDVNCYPTILLLDEKGDIINRFEGFIDSKSIDINIKEYETKCMV